MSPLDYIKIYDDFWRSIVEDKFGLPNMDQIKRELSDYYLLINEVPKVYRYATGEKITTGFLMSEEVIKAIDEYIYHKFAFMCKNIINDIKFEQSQEQDYDKNDGMEIAIKVIKNHINVLGGH
jgi:hypothetical protein